MNSDEEMDEIREKQERLLKYARKGNIVGCQQLLDEGADINYIVWWESLYSCALYTAVDHGQTACVRFLLDHGADPNSGADYDNSLTTSLLCSLDHNYKDIIRLLLEAGADTQKGSPFHIAMKYENNDDILKLLIKYNGNMNTFHHYYKNTPLHFACIQNNASYVNLLLNHGADPSIRDRDGELPIHYANDDIRALFYPPIKEPEN